MNQAPHMQEAPSGDARPTRPKSRSTVLRSTVAVVMLLTFLLSQRVANPWRPMIRRQVTQALSENIAWTGWVHKTAAQLILFVEQRSWGRIVSLWLPHVAPVGARLIAGEWAFPVPAGHVSETFGWHHAGNGYRFEPGIQISASAHSPVVSVAGGTVLREIRTSQGAILTVGMAPGLQVRYLHLLRVLVSPHRAVQLGQTVGLTGGTPLLVEVMVRGYPVNPMLSEYLGQHR